MQFQIYFTQTVVMPTDVLELRSFLNAIKKGLSTNANVEADLRKPLRDNFANIWFFCFEKSGVVYQIENNQQVKIFLRFQLSQDCCKEDVAQMVQPDEDVLRLLYEYRNESISLSLEEIEAQLAQDERDRNEWAKSRLELLVECGSKLCAENFFQHFDRVILTLISENKAQYQCRAEIYQDIEENWWCRICPISISTIPKTVAQMIQLQSRLYDSLHSAPAFRYALACVGAYQYLINDESPQTYSKVLRGDIHPVAYIEGMVLSETIWRKMKLPPKSFKPFSQGYVWMSTRVKLTDSRAFQPVLESDPQSAQEYYNNGSILGHQGQHEKALVAFEAALSLNPTFDLAYNSKDAALFHLGRSREEVLEFYEALIRSMPDYAFAYLKKAIFLDELGRYAEAFHLVETSLQLDPNSVQAHHSKGIILDHLNQPKAALSALEESLRLDPNYEPAQASKRIVLLRLDALHKSNQKTSELEVLKKRLLELVYGDRDICNRLVEAEYRRSPHKSEVQWYRDAIERLERNR